MRVRKRNQTYEAVAFDKVVRRIANFCGDLTALDPHTVAQKICSRIYDGVDTSKLDELGAEICSSLMTEHPDYGILAARIVISNHQKNTLASFADTIELLAGNVDAHGNAAPIVSAALVAVVRENAAAIEAEIHHDRDYLFDYFGFKTLERSYLLKVGDRIVERPQHMWMRVALGIHALAGAPLADAFEAYHLMSTRMFTHATPTLFNAGTPRPGLSSCFLMGVHDSIDGIYKSLGDGARISKYSGGIGLHVHNIRGKGAIIRGTNGQGNGIVPMLRVYNNTFRYVNQSGKRNGSAAIYLEPWHVDVFEFIALRRNTGSEEERCRDLFLALWIPDLFMERVKAGGDWSLFCPDSAPGLSDVHGDAFVELYERYEREGRARKVVKAQELWSEIVRSQIETGVPYMLYKDKCQRVNQSNLGIIRSSNLCSEILLYSDPEEYGVCNLASIVLPSYVKTGEAGPAFDFDLLHDVAKKVTRSMDRVIDVNYYSCPETARSNFRHRPIGVGIQGLADVYMMMRVPFDSDEAMALNRDIMETIYHATLEASMEIARDRKLALAFDTELRAAVDDLLASADAERCRAELRLRLTDAERDAVAVVLDGDVDGTRLVADLGATTDVLRAAESRLRFTDEERALPTDWAGAYSTFAGSPASQGVLQFDMWGVAPSDRYDWTGLKAAIQAHGLRHSMLIALMPTASTSQIMGYTESFEPITANFMVRRTLAGEFIIVNKYLVRDLMALGLWDRAMKDRILAGNGSIQHIEEIPEATRALYKTVWEIKQRVLIDQSAARVPYVCHTQSLNLYMEDPDLAKITNMHFYGWRKGLKTGMYYLRTRPRAKTMSFTLDPALLAATGKVILGSAGPSAEEVAACRRDNPEGCLMCSA